MGVNASISRGAANEGESALEEAKPWIITPDNTATVKGVGITIGLAWPARPSTPGEGADNFRMLEQNLVASVMPGEKTAAAIQQQGSKPTNLPAGSSEGNTSAADESDAEVTSTATAVDSGNLPVFATSVSVADSAEEFYSQLARLSLVQDLPPAQTTFMHLPSECQLKILGRLENLSDWLSFRLVSKHLSKLADWSVRSLAISEFHEVTATDLECGVAQFPNLVELHLPFRSLNDVDNDLIMAAGLFCRHLRKIHLDNFWEWTPYTTYDRVALLVLFRGCIFLEDVHIVCDGAQQQIPPSLWDLAHLQRLVVSDWPAFNRVPREVGRLKSLRELDVRNAAITSLPRELWTLANLEKLSLESVIKMEQLAKPIAALSALRLLRIQASGKPSPGSQKNLIHSLGRLSNLESLALLDCLHLQLSLWRPVQHLPNLVDLEVTLPNYVPLADLLQLSEWRTKLKSLSIPGRPQTRRQVEGLAVPDAIDQLVPNLRHLRITNCPALQWVPSQVAELSHLEELELGGGFDSLPDNLGALTNLTRLCVGPCTSLSGLPPSIPELVGLREINLLCDGATKLPEGFESLPKLESLKLQMKTLTTLPETMRKMVRLTRLEVMSEAMAWLPNAVGTLPRLEYLKIECPQVAFLPSSIGTLPSLRTLALRRCDSITSLPPALGSISNLRRLEIECPELRSLPSTIGSLERLTRLMILNCCRLSSVPATIGSLNRLRRLTLHNCLAVTSLPDTISQLSALVRLDLLMCPSLKALPESLSKLRLQCLLLQSLWELSALPESLGELNNEQAVIHVKDCPMLDKLPGSLAEFQGEIFIDDARGRQIKPPGWTLRDGSAGR